MTTPTPQATIWNALRGALVTRALAVAADLQVAQSLACGPRSVEDVCRPSGADADTVRRVLRALASDGIFAETERGVFRNTEASEILLEEGWSEFAHLCGGLFLAPAAGLTAGGGAVFPALHEGVAFWPWLAANPDERAAFDRAMRQGWERRVDRLDSVGWRGDETVVDVGGGNGSQLVAFLERYPEMRGIVFDLPETVRDESGFGDRCIFVAGDFFQSVPAGDAYVLSTILHDWDDESALRILHTIRAAAPSGARLVLLESTIGDGNEPDGSKWLDLLMLVLFDGRERDEPQWRTLLDGGGFDVQSIGVGVIEARCR